MSTKSVLVLSTIFCSPFLSHAEDMRTISQEQTPAEHTARARMAVTEIKNQERLEKLVDDTSSVYAAIAKGPKNQVPASVLRSAKCIAVIPNVITGALVVGGAHGQGLASCKDDNNKWSQPAPISLNQASIGLQAGGKSADLVLFIVSQDAVQALKRGKFTIGTDVSAVAGSFESNLDTSKAGVLVYSRTDGVFAGASVTGGQLGRDQDDIDSYYGKKVDYTALLEGRESPDGNGYTQRLTKLFP